MSTRPRRSRFLALVAIREHFRETAHPPSLSDLGRRLRCSRQRVHALVKDLEREGLITRTRGEAFSIRLVEPGGMVSDTDLSRALADRVRRRDPVATAAIGAALRSVYEVEALTTMPLPDRALIDQLLDRLSGGSGGKSDGTKSEGAA